MSRRTLTLRLEPEIFDALSFIADRSGETMDAFIQRAVVNALDEARGHLEQDLERALELLQTLQLDPRQDDADFGEFEGTAPDPAEGTVVEMTDEEIRQAQLRTLRSASR